MYRKNVHLTFPPEISNNPIVCQLAQNYGLIFNILKAQINPGREGRMMLEIRGPRDTCGRALDFLAESGVIVTSAAQRISRDGEGCMHCGMCTAMCPSGALSVDRESRLLRFDLERCNVCGLCARVCPVRAMHVEME
ncbi:MAG: 4Fe-4S binding protein [Desulfovibrionaceae bacterium]|nr:4Fe-4S binding protein [Desulfovibrionaceae bacterium]